MANSSGTGYSKGQYGILKSKEISQNGTLYYAKAVATIQAPDSTWTPQTLNKSNKSADLT